MSLNVQYFEKVHVESREGVQYESYRPRDKPMVLFSLVDGAPLASLTLRCQTTSTQVSSDGTRGKALITARPDNSTDDLQKFQGLIDRDGQEFELVITNLSSSGHINFNVLKSDEKVSTVNPLGLNEINELRPSESYAVKCSQENNLSLILSSIKDEATGASVSIKQDEDHSKQTGEKTKGTYYFLSIVPEASNKELCTKFEKTVWRCVDLLVRETKVTQPLFAPHPYANGLWGNTFGNDGNYGNAMYENTRYVPNRASHIGRGMGRRMDGGAALPVAKGIRKCVKKSNMITDECERNVNVPLIGVNTIGSSLKNASHDLTSLSYVPKDITPGLNLSSSGLKVSDEYRPMPKTLDELRPINKPKVAYETNMLYSDLMDSCKLKPKYAQEENCKMNFDEEEDEEEWDEEEEDEDELDDYESEENLALNAKYPPRPSSKSKSTTSLSQQDDVIMSSHAASIKYGKHIQVNSTETGIVYDYDKSCARCVVGLSVSDKLEFYPEPDMQELITDSKDIIQEYLEKKYVQVLEKTYDLGDCCICLDEDPDTVFYQCGHKCIHISCIDKDINKCPVCRTRISAYLKLNKTNPDNIVVGIIDEAELEFESESESNDKEFTDNDIDISEDHDEIPKDIKDKVVIINA